MKLRNRLLVLVTGAALTCGTLVGCGSESSQSSSETATASREATTTTTTGVAPMPQAVTFTAAMPGSAGHSMMTLAVVVEGENVVAYACNGTNDDAWFMGTQRDGVMNLTSAYKDTLTATFDGTSLEGTLTMNVAGATPLNFTATESAGPAGIYTATDGGARASWVVMPDGQMIGVRQPNSRNDREVIDRINAEQQQFQDQVRQARLDRQLQQAPAPSMTSMTVDMDGRSVGVMRVTGSMRSLPNSN